MSEFDTCGQKKDWVTGNGTERGRLISAFATLTNKAKELTPTCPQQTKALKKLEEAKSLFEIAILTG